MKTLNKQEKIKPKNYIIRLKAFNRLNNLIGGFNEGELVVIAARPGVGKTTLSLELACLFSEFDPVLFESLEMSFNELRTKATKFYDVSLLKKLYVNDDSAITVKTIEKHIKKIKPKFVFIDYLQIMGGNIRRNTKELKALAKKYKCIIVLLSQLNREAKGEQIDLTMLRDSGTIEQDADQVWFINNESIIVAKNRKGETGSLPIVFYKEQSFISIDNKKVEDLYMLDELVRKACEARSTFKFRKIMKQIREINPEFYSQLEDDELLNYKNILMY